MRRVDDVRVDVERRLDAGVTRFCLVTFAEPKCRPHYVRTALTYVYYALHDLGFSIQCNTNFDGQGVPVPREWVEHIEWL